MNSLRIFRLLVIAEIVLAVASIAISFLPYTEPPPEVDRWLSQDGRSLLVRWMEGESIPALAAALAVGIAFVAAYAASLVGLLLLKRWARTLYVAVFVAGVILYPFMGAALTTPVGALVDYLLAASTGAILALLFVGPVQERFAHA